MLKFIFHITFSFCEVFHVTISMVSSPVYAKSIGFTLLIVQKGGGGGGQKEEGKVGKMLKRDRKTNLKMVLMAFSPNYSC